MRRSPLQKLVDIKQSSQKTNSSFMNQVGMTLMEIMIVMGIIGFILAMILPGIFEKQKKAKVNQTKIAIGQIVQAINLFVSDCQAAPKSLKALSEADADCGSWGPDPYMKKVPKDGWGKEFFYEIDGGNFILKSLGSDGKEGGDGYNKDITSDEI